MRLPIAPEMTFYTQLGTNVSRVNRQTSNAWVFFGWVFQLRSKISEVSTTYHAKLPTIIQSMHSK